MWRRRRPQSIYRHVLEHVEPGVPGLGEGGERLPDDETAFEGGIRWAPGALEGVISRYGAEPEEMEPRVSELTPHCCAWPTEWVALAEAALERPRL